jgi:hypothetical protein
VTPRTTSGRDLLLRVSLVQQLTAQSADGHVAINMTTAKGSSVEEGALRAGTSMSSLKIYAFPWLISNQRNLPIGLVDLLAPLSCWELAVLGMQ